MKPSFHITTIEEEVFYKDSVEALMGGIRDLGYDVTFTHRGADSSKINILFGAQILPYKFVKDTAEHVVVYNMEQMNPLLKHINKIGFFHLMKNTQIWDYSQRNVDVLLQHGIHHVKHVPLGFSTEQQRLKSLPEIEQDIDVMFYGMRTPRRQKVIDQMRAMGLNVSDVHVHGEDKDRLIERSKVVLNIRQHDADQGSAQIFEIARVGFLLANQKAVVSELTPETEIYAGLQEAFEYGSVETLAQLCADLVKDETRRRALEKKALHVYERYQQSDFLEEAVASAVDIYEHKTSPKIFSLPTTKPVSLPKKLHLGSGRNWQFDYVNVDLDERLYPDVVLNFEEPLPFGKTLPSWRFNEVVLEQGYFDYILTEHVLEHVHNLTELMHNCLLLLKEGGLMEIEVPYDLSLGAWQDPTHVRAFNQNSWKYFTDWWFYYHRLGGEYRFHLEDIRFNINAMGQKMLTDNGGDSDAVINTARMVDSIRVKLRKIRLSPEELAFAEDRFPVYD